MPNLLPSRNMPAWDQCRRAFAWVNRLPPGAVTALATLGPIGRTGPAPGTLGSVAGALLAAALAPMLADGRALLVLAPLVYLAVAVCDRAGVLFGETDPGKIILDEFAAMPVCFLGVFPAALARGWPSAAVLLAGFALFRLFDIAKPLGIARLQRWPGGLGVVADDLAAALATCVVLHGVLRFA